MTRLTIDITDEQHEALTDDEEKAMGELKVLLQERLARAERGAVSTKSIDQVFDEVMRTSKLS